jgi:methyl-accepting chemotaxis protein
MMSWFNNLSIKFKLMLAPLLALVGFLTFLLYEIGISYTNIHRLEELRDRQLPLITSTASNVELLERMSEVFNAVVTTGDKDMVTGAESLAQQLRNNFDVAAKLDAASAQELNAKLDSLDEFYNSAKRLSVGMVDGTLSMSAMGQAAKDKQQLFDQLRDTLAADRQQAEDSFNAAIAQTNNAISHAIMVGIAIAISVAVVMVVISLAVTMLLTRQINSVSSSLKEIAQGEGDLTQRLPTISHDEIGDLVRWFNLIIDKLHMAVKEVVEVEEPLSLAAEKLMMVADQSKQNSHEQKDSSTTLLTAMDELILSVSNIAESAATAASATAEADDDARSGTQKVAATVSSINNLAGEITEAAGVISKLQKDAENVGVILDVIKGIAEQTNLLALNAAIEAARAGEQGRGFAVVADEVRTLASRTQESTQEIQQVIEQLQQASQSAVAVMTQSQEGARNSVEQVEDTGATLGAISTRVASIADMNNQIAAATEEQDATTKLIQSSVSSLSDAADRVVNSTDEVNVLGDQLRNFAQQLSHVAGQFKV